MEPSTVLDLLQEIIEDAKTAILATVDEQGTPRMRWVTPAFLKGRRGAIYTITSPEFAKANHIEKNPRIEWLFQTRGLTTIMNIRGKISILRNASIRSETLEVVSPRLHAFWMMRKEESDLIVLETLIEEATILFPRSGHRETVTFAERNNNGG
jgi:general stress protein 26